MLQMGLYSHLGAADYLNAVTGKSDVLAWRPHGVVLIQTALRMIAAWLQPNQVVPLHETANNVQLGVTLPVWNVRLALPAIPFMGNTGYVAPNAIKTFDHADQTICAPALIHPPLVGAVVWIWKNVKGPQHVFAPLSAGPVLPIAASLEHHMNVPSYSSQRAGGSKTPTGHVSRRDQKSRQQHKAAERKSKSRSPSGSRSKSRSASSRGRSSSRSGRSGGSSTRGSSRSRSRSSGRQASPAKQRSKSRSKSPKSHSKSPQGRKRSQSKSPKGKRRRSTTPGPGKKRVSFANKKGGKKRNKNPNASH